MPELNREMKTNKSFVDEGFVDEGDEAMREEFNRIWVHSISFLLPPEIVPGSEASFKIFVACWTAYCVGMRAIPAPNPRQLNG